MTKGWLFNSLTQAEYPVTFNAFIYSYIMTHFFSGWGRLISNRKYLNSCMSQNLNFNEPGLLQTQHFEVN